MVFELNPGFNPTTLLLSGMQTHRLHTDNKSRTCEASCGFSKWFDNDFFFSLSVPTEKHDFGVHMANTKGSFQREQLCNYTGAV